MIRRAYVERRRAMGDTVEIVQDVYLRAVLIVNGTRRRMWNPYGSWRYA